VWKARNSTCRYSLFWQLQAIWNKDQSCFIISFTFLFYLPPFHNNKFSSSFNFLSFFPYLYFFYLLFFVCFLYLDSFFCFLCLVSFCFFFFLFYKKVTGKKERKKYKFNEPFALIVNNNRVCSLCFLSLIVRISSSFLFFSFNFYLLLTCCLSKKNIIFILFKEKVNLIIGLIYLPIKLIQCQK
jgi:hypothetical protein